MKLLYFHVFDTIRCSVFIKQMKGLDTCLKFERTVIGKSNCDDPRIHSLTRTRGRLNVSHFPCGLPYQTVRQSLANPLAITSSNNETQFPRFPCNYLVEQKLRFAGVLLLHPVQQATIPLSTSRR